MEIVSVDIDDCARVGDADGFSFAAKVTFTARDSAAGSRPFRLRVEVAVPLDEHATLQALEGALLAKAVEVAGAVQELSVEQVAALARTYLAQLRG